MTEKKIKSGVYAITCLINGKRYVGSAVNLTLRFTVHRYHLRRNQHHCKHLQRAWNKYGESNFEFKIIKRCKPELLQNSEQHYMDTTPKIMLMNSQPFARTCFGFKHTVKTKAKMRLKAKQISNTPEQKLLRSERAKRQHAEGRIGIGGRKAKLRVCVTCEEKWLPERTPSGHLNQSKFCKHCRPEHKGGYYKYERALWDEGRPKQHYPGRED